jgi:hypothetical protein
MSKTLIGPAYGHIFGSDSVKAEVTSIREHRKVQRTMVIFYPLTIRANRMIAGTSAAAERCNDEDQEQASHGSLTPDILQSSFVALLPTAGNALN